jgi:uncharacterized protein (DUF58 family)
VAAIAQRQGDAFGLVTLGGGRVQFMPAARGPRQLQRVLAQLARVVPDGVLPDAEALRAGLHFARSPSLVFVASDFLDWPSPLSAALLRLRAMRHDVRALCLETDAERNASFDAGQAYRDPEQGSGVFRFGPGEREAYRSARAAHFAGVTAQCRKNDVPLLAAAIEQAPAEVLRKWLRQAGRA